MRRHVECDRLRSSAVRVEGCSELALSLRADMHDQAALAFRRQLPASPDGNLAARGGAAEDDMWAGGARFVREQLELKRRAATAERIGEQKCSALGRVAPV